MANTFKFTDAITASKIEFNYDDGSCTIESATDKAPQIDSIFFPGCSMINYAIPLVEAVYNTLCEHKIVEGISVLCCGKILQYEPNGQVLRDEFEAELRDHVSRLGIKRIVCACPNCVKALRDAFALDDRTCDIELVVLPKLLVELGYRIDKATAARLIKGDENAAVLLAPHDSCPDRAYGDFADGLRAIMPDDMWKDPAHCRKTSICCGSLPRAQGKIEAADKCADTNGKEAVEIGADSIVTPCMSCTFQLNMAQPHIQCVHFLELLYDWRINWATVGQWMKYRFLFKETLGAQEVESQTQSRKFIGMDEITQGSSDPIKREDVAISFEDDIEIA